METVTLRLTAGGMTLSTAGKARHTSGTIETQDRQWWASLREACAGMGAMAVILDPPESHPLALPHAPHSRREMVTLIDRLAPLRNRYLSATAPHQANGGIVVTIAHAARLHALRALFEANGIPPPLFLAADGTSAFDVSRTVAVGGWRVTGIVVLAAALAIPLLSTIGATILTAQIHAQIAKLDRVQAAADDARQTVRELAAAPTVASRLASVARHLPDTGTVVALSGDGGTRVSITLDATDPENMRQALRRAGTFGTVHEISRTRTADGYRIVYSGVPQ